MPPSIAGQYKLGDPLGVGAVEAAHRFFQLHLEPIYQPAYERDVAALRDRLGDAAFEATFAEGNAMTLDEAIEYALEGVVTG